jgi:transcriptional regulator with XRE-family HTH domain
MPAVKKDEIRRLRQRTGLRLGEFAERSGINYKTLANIECGHQVPGPELIHRLASALGAEVEDLLAEPAEAAA